jgi:multidrug efflux pump subunit AcrA (membrane-fusion protein)
MIAQFRAPTAAEDAPAVVSRAPASARPRRRLWLIAGVVVLALAGLALAFALASPSAPPAAPPTATATAPRLTAHGEVNPLRRAHVGTLTGGVVASLAVEVGQRVGDHQELGRVRLATGQVEVLVAPFPGTVTGLLVREGDTLLPGTTVATVADLNHLVIDTTDVDEYLIAHLRPGQPVTVTIDALDRRELAGHIRALSLETQTTTAGDAQYPVTIELEGTPPDLRPGMSARVTFAE